MYRRYITRQRRPAGRISALDPPPIVIMTIGRGFTASVGAKAHRGAVIFSAPLPADKKEDKVPSDKTSDKTKDATQDSEQHADKQDEGQQGAERQARRDATKKEDRVPTSSRPRHPWALSPARPSLCRASGQNAVRHHDADKQTPSLRRATRQATRKTRCRAGAQRNTRCHPPREDRHKAVPA